MKYRRVLPFIIFPLLLITIILSPHTLFPVAGQQEGQLICSLSTEVYTPQPKPENSIRFAVIGDFGTVNYFSQRVADMVTSWIPDFIVTVGDNNYPSGEEETIDENIGQLYGNYIGNYDGDYGDGSVLNNFYPALGNHDWRTDSGNPYFEYFTLPGNERYYDFIRGSVHFFILDSHRLEPDGTDDESIQAQWLQSVLTASPTPFQVVIAHHPPYSSSIDSEIPHLRWPFAEWGADIVLSGHAHHYERFEHDGIPYIVNGSGGHMPLYEFQDTLADGSIVQDNCNFGAIQVDADDNTMTMRFISVTVEGYILDQITISADDKTGK